MKRSLVLVVLALVFAAGVGLRAEAVTSITCGTVLPDEPGPKDVTFKLKHNLSCNASVDPAIALGDHTILDLGGHTLTGGGFGDGVLANGKDHASVIRGTIKNFVTPVHFENGNGDGASRLKLAGGSSDVNLFGTSNAVVTRDVMSTAGFACVEISGASGSVIRTNRLACTGSGVRIDGAARNNVVTRNRITGGTFGVDVNTNSSGLGHTLVTLNRIKGAGQGIDVGPTASNENILKNKISGSTINGIRVESGATGIDVGGNSTKHNVNDGILIQATTDGIQVGSNTADDNGNYGIEAVPATDDAGGNRAKRNGNSFQCLSVICL